MPTQSCFFRGHGVPWSGSGEGRAAQGSREPSVQLLLISKEPINTVFRASASASVFRGLVRWRVPGVLGKRLAFPRPL